MSRSCGFAFDLVLLTVSGGKEGNELLHSSHFGEETNQFLMEKIIELITFKQTFHVGALDRIHSIHISGRIFNNIPTNMLIGSFDVTT